VWWCKSVLLRNLNEQLYHAGTFCLVAVAKYLLHPSQKQVYTLLMHPVAVQKPRIRASGREKTSHPATKTLNSGLARVFYGVRYLDPKTSRWISADPAMGEYIPQAPINDEVKKRNGNLPGMGGVFNYVNFHVYHYAGNNPVVMRDPEGMWDSRIHYGSNEYGGTLQWAQDVGFTEKQAEIIARANDNTDMGPTGPFPGQSPERHFNTGNAPSNSVGDTRLVISEDCLQRAIVFKKAANEYRKKGLDNEAAIFEESALKNLGIGLHSLQDVYAHTDELVSEGLLGIYSHADPRNPINQGKNRADDPEYQPVRLDSTKNASKVYLERYLEATRGLE